MPYLTARPEGVRVTEAARDFGVGERQLRSDLELLWMCGLPGYGPGDLIDLSFEGDRVRVTFTAGMGRPLRLTTDEAVALVVALRTLVDLPGLAEREAVSRALAKVSAAAGHAADRVTPVAVSVDAREQALAVVRDGLERKRALHLHYYVPTRDERTERTVDPMRLLLVDGKWYLEAWCRRAEGVRLFRLDRVDDVVVLDEPAAAAAAGPRARRRQRRLPARARTRRRCACGCPAAPGGWPTTTRSTRSTSLDDGGLEVTVRDGRPGLGPPAGGLAGRRRAGARAGRAGRRDRGRRPGGAEPRTGSTRGRRPATPVRVAAVVVLIVWIVVVVLALVVLGAIGVRAARRGRPAAPRARGEPSATCAAARAARRRPPTARRLRRTEPARDRRAETGSDTLRRSIAGATHLWRTRHGLDSARWRSA